MIDIRIAMNDIYKNLEPTLTKCGFRITTPADISDGIPVSVTSGRAVMDFSGDSKGSAYRALRQQNSPALGAERGCERDRLREDSPFSARC